MPAFTNRNEDTTTRRRYLQLLQIIACVTVFVCGTASAGKKCDKIVEEFVIANTRIYRDYSNPLERQEFYKEALQQLLKNARSLYGPFCPCDEFLTKAAALQKHREDWRSPPPGWEPSKLRATFLPLEVEIAREDVRLLMDLMSLCDGH